MKRFQLGDIITGIEYCGDEGLVVCITETTDEILYTLGTYRYKDNFRSNFEIGYNKNTEKMYYSHSSIHGGTYWSECNWDVKKIGVADIKECKTYTLFKDEEPDRDD